MLKKLLIGLGAALTLIVFGFLHMFFVQGGTLNEAEEKLVASIESGINERTGLELNARTRTIHKVNIGFGEDPWVYKLAVTSGRPGERVEVDYARASTVEQAEKRNKDRWVSSARRHEGGGIRDLKIDLDLADSALYGALLNTHEKQVGTMFVARYGRGTLGVTLHGIVLNSDDDFRRVLAEASQLLRDHGDKLLSGDRVNP